MEILSVDQIRAADAYTIKYEPIASIDLMERACLRFCDYVVKHFPLSQSIAIACGPGNNGGDGLGIARIMHNSGFSCAVYILSDTSGSADYITNLNRLPEEIPVHIWTGDEAMVFTEDVIIDAIFGSGLNRPPEGIYADWIKSINGAGKFILSVDIPSGLFADQTSSHPVIHSDLCLTFQYPKLAFFLPENAPYINEWHVLDIGLLKEFTTHTEVYYTLFTELEFLKHRKIRDHFSHKGNFGKLLLAGGSKGKIGAQVLSARAALRSGAGLVTSYIPACGYSILQSTVPEAMVLCDPGVDTLSSLPSHVHAYSAIGIGPGMGTDLSAVEALREFLEEVEKPMVIDADALNIVSENRQLISLIPENSILTPHPGEFKRLVGDWTDDFERLNKQRDFSQKYKVHIVLKGAYTSITCPKGHVSFNTTGNPGMATAGSGDVLTGIITSLLAQGYVPNMAAALGVYIHGAAGDFASVLSSQESLIASDIIDHLGEVFRIWE